MRIKVIFDRVYVRNDADTFGSGEFYFIAEVDGQTVGNRSTIFNAVERSWLDLPDDQWSAVVDVRNKTRVEVRFQGRDDDVFCDDDLGSISYVLRPPWRQRTFRSRTRYYVLEWRVELEVHGQFGRHAPLEVFACRQQSGAHECTTVSGARAQHRIEICPVVPVPGDGDLPPRPRFPAGTHGERTAPQAIFLAPGHPPNVVPNPAVIPILAQTAATADTAARIEITHYHPNTLRLQENDPRLVWSYRRLAGQPTVRFVAPSGGTAAQGLRVLVHGTGTHDGEVLLDVRYRGSLLASYRALVARIRRIPCRVTILNGSGRGVQPRSTPQHVLEHLEVANLILRQIGLELLRDADATVSDGATPALDGRRQPIPGVFRINRISAGLTRNVDWSANSGFIRSSGLNSRPNVVNIVYVKSVRRIRHRGRWVHPYGLSTDRPANPAGTSVTDSGNPSTSWVQPSGVPPDGEPRTVTMNLAGARQRRSDLAALWVRDFTDPSDSHRYGYVIAHEVGHILGLLHRGRNVPGTHDGVGHPPSENVMFDDEDTLGLDLDIIQARAVRRSNLIRS